MNTCGNCLCYNAKEGTCIVWVSIKRMMDDKTGKTPLKHLEKQPEDIACKDCNMAHRAKHPEETQKMEDWVAEYRKTHG